MTGVSHERLSTPTRQREARRESIQSLTNDLAAQWNQVQQWTGASLDLIAELKRQNPELARKYWGRLLRISDRITQYGDVVDKTKEASSRFVGSLTALENRIGEVEEVRDNAKIFLKSVSSLGREVSGLVQKH